VPAKVIRAPAAHTAPDFMTEAGGAPAARSSDPKE
jgi:hypothetical protein